MFRTLSAGLLALVALAVAGGPAEAFGRRSAAPTVCYPVYPVYCYPVCCPVTPCCVYEAVGTPVPLGGPYPTVVLGGVVGQGLIVRVDVPDGTTPAVTELFQVEQTGTGELKYDGWNKTEVTLPTGKVTRYSFFFCPRKAGTVSVGIGFARAGNTMTNVPFSFNIR